MIANSARVIEVLTTDRTVCRNLVKDVNTTGFELRKYSKGEIGSRPVSPFFPKNDFVEELIREEVEFQISLEKIKIEQLKRGECDLDPLSSVFESDQRDFEDERLGANPYRRDRIILIPKDKLDHLIHKTVQEQSVRFHLYTDEAEFKELSKSPSMSSASSTSDSYRIIVRDKEAARENKIEDIYTMYVLKDSKPKSIDDIRDISSYFEAEAVKLEGKEQIYTAYGLQEGKDSLSKLLLNPVEYPNGMMLLSKYNLKKIIKESVKSEINILEALNAEKERSARQKKKKQKKMFGRIRNIFKRNG